MPPDLLGFLDDLPAAPVFPHSLPEGVVLLSYSPVEVPVKVSSYSECVRRESFIQAYMADLKVRLENPKKHSAPPLEDILSKLAAVGVRLKVQCL